MSTGRGCGWVDRRETGTHRPALLIGGHGLVNLIVAVVRSNMDRAVGWSLIAAGGVAVVVGWVGVSGAPTAASRVSYLVSGGRRCCCHPIRASELVRDAYLGKAAVA